MRRIAGLCMAVAVLALAAGCGKKSSTSADSGGGGTSSLEGTYLLVGMEAGGKQFATEEELAKEPEGERIFKVTADKMIATKNGKEDPVTYKLDPSKTPKEIDLAGKKFDGKDEKMYGIYKLEGDKLTICMVESDKPADRPKEFKTADKGKSVMMTFKKK